MALANVKLSIARKTLITSFRKGYTAFLKTGVLVVSKIMYLLNTSFNWQVVFFNELLVSVYFHFSY